MTNTAGAIDPTSRTLLTELEVPNETEELLPGAYAQINLKLEGDTGLVTVPSNALLFRSEGASVGVVHPDGKVEIRKIVINRDLGRQAADFPRALGIGPSHCKSVRRPRRRHGRYRRDSKANSATDRQGLRFWDAGSWYRARLRPSQG